DEGVPVAVDLDAAELEEGLRALRDPAHAGGVEALSDDVADGALDGPGADLEVLVQELAVVHEADALREIGQRSRETRSLPLVAGTGLRERVEPLLQLAQDRLDLAVEDARLVRLDPVRERLAAFAVEAAARLPDVLQGMDHVQGEDRLGEELLGVALEVLLAVDHDLDALA